MARSWTLKACRHRDADLYWCQPVRLDENPARCPARQDEGARLSDGSATANPNSANRASTTSQAAPVPGLLAPDHAQSPARRVPALAVIIPLAGCTRPMTAARVP